MMPNVSIVVPVFNSAGSVEASLRSLFAQSLRSLEVIAVNDASVDGSSKILDRLAAEEPRLKVLHCPKNLGVHEARSVGVRESTAPWIGFMDSDDYARPEMFSLLLERCRSTDCDIALCSVELVDQRRRRIGGRVSFPRKEVVEADIFKRFCRMEFGTCALWNKLYRREILLPHALRSFRWRQDATEDTLVNLGCFHDARRIALLTDVLYEYVVHRGSATQSVSGSVGFCRQVRAFAIAIDTYRELGDEVVRGITELYRRQFEYECHQIDDLASLGEMASAVSEAVSLLATQAPSALASVIARRPQPAIRLKSASGLLRDGVALSRAFPPAVIAAVRRRL